MESKLAIDTSVYRSFGSLRTVYAAKLRSDGKSYPLIPYLESSPRIQDHLVIAHPEIINHDFSNIVNFVYSIPTPKVHKISKKVPKYSVLPSINDHASIETSNFDPTHINSIEALIKSSQEILDAVGVKSIAFAYNQPSSFDPNVYDFWIDHQLTPICCPYAKRTHASNRSCLSYNHRYKTITIKCMNQSDRY
jgi:hypothetical protein